jgi:hypothetical protein
MVGSAVVRGPVVGGLLVLALTSLGLPREAFAQTVALQTTTDRTEIYAGESVTLTIQATFSSASGGRIRLSDPAGTDFTVVGRTQFTTSNRFGRTRTTQFTQIFTLRPRRTGSLTIGPVTIAIGANAYSSEPQTVEVIAPGTAATAPPTPSRTPPPPEPTPAPVRPDAPTEQPPLPNFPSVHDASVPLLTVSPSSPQVYAGEQFIADYEMYSARDARWQLVGIRQPSLEGFWFDIVPADTSRYTPRSITVGRRVFVSDLASRFILVALEPGDHELAAFEVDAARGSRRLALSSEPRAIRVLPLPTGAPRGMSQSNVGQYAFEMDVDVTGRRVGDSIRVTMRVEGSGLVSLVDLPTLRVRGANIQPPIDDREQSVLRSGRIGGYSQRTWIVIPTEEGELVIPSVGFSYFDPTAGTYQTVEAEGMTVTIEGQAPGAELLVSTEIDEHSRLLEALGEPRDTTVAVDGYVIPRPLLWGLSLFPLGIFLLGVLFGRVRSRRERSRPDRQKRSALGRAKRSIKQATRVGGNEGYGQVAKALRLYLKERYEIKAAALTTSGTAEALGRQNVADELASEVSGILDVCETAQFDQDSSSDGEMIAVATRAAKALTALEARK